MLPQNLNSASFIGLIWLALIWPNIEAITHHLEIYYMDINIDIDTMEMDRPILPTKDFAAICNRGVWVVYSGPSYTFDPDHGWVSMFLHINEGGCIIPHEEHVQRGALENNASAQYVTLYSKNSPPRESNSIVKSARRVGAKPDNTDTSVTFYSKEWMVGDAFVLEKGEEGWNFTFPVNSIVTIRAEQVEIFTEPGLQGDSLCLDFVEAEMCHHVVCWIVSQVEFAIWETPLEKAKSARIGCTDKNPGSFAPTTAPGKLFIIASLVVILIQFIV